MKQNHWYQSLFVVVAAGLAGSLALTAGCKKPESDSGTQLPEAAVNTATSSRSTNPEMKVLVGRWLRPDVDFLLEILSVATNGELDVRYSAPRLVGVGKAVATQVGGKVQVVIELSDPSLAGSKYTLTFEPQANRLNGVYYRAALNETEEIFFIRQ